MALGRVGKDQIWIQAVSRDGDCFSKGDGTKKGVKTRRISFWVAQQVMRAVSSGAFGFRDVIYPRRSWISNYLGLFLTLSVS